jgi:hypothetical protein
MLPERVRSERRPGSIRVEEHERGGESKKRQGPSQLLPRQGCHMGFAIVSTSSKDNLLVGCPHFHGPTETVWKEKAPGCSSPNTGSGVHTASPQQPLAKTVDGWGTVIEGTCLTYVVIRVSVLVCVDWCIYTPSTCGHPSEHGRDYFNLVCVMEGRRGRKKKTQSRGGCHCETDVSPVAISAREDEYTLAWPESPSRHAR